MPTPRIPFIAAVIAILLFAALPARAGEVAVSLRGSPNSMVRQNSVAKDLGFEFVKTPEQLPVLVEQGEFVPVVDNDHLEVLKSVSYPYARPEVRLFVERLAEQYYEDTGEKLVVTSLTRPTTEQPGNSHALSVHPAGIAIDLRISSRRASQQWLEAVLLKLERQGLLDITRERYPPHYHVAVFPQAYRAHVEAMIGADAIAEAMNYDVPPEEEPAQEQAAVTKRPVTTAAAAVPAIKKGSIEAHHVLALAFPLLAAMFFGLGYWRGAARKRGADSEEQQEAGWSTFTVTTTQ